MGEELGCASGVFKTIVMEIYYSMLGFIKSYKHLKILH